MKDEATKYCTIDNFFCLNRAINLAPLELTKQVDAETFNNIGQLHYRNSAPHKTTNQLVGDISIDDIFKKSKEHANAIFAKTKHYSEELKQIDINVCANMVGVIGQAGMGKTALTKSLLQQIIDERLFDSNYVFYLQFREVDYKNETNLLSFLAKNLCLSWTTNEARRNAVLKKLSSRNDVILIMDGFDEALITKFSAKSPSVKVSDNAKPELFIKNIMKGSILGNAKKILTSRPRQLLEIPKEFRPKFLLSILGLGLEAQYQVCKSICNDNTDSVFNYIQQHPSIATYCYVPCNCILVMHAVNSINDQQQEEETFSMPNTISGILSIVLCLFVQSPLVRDNQSAFCLKNLANLAWKGFETRKFCFKETDLQNAGINNNERSLFFVMRLAKTALSLVGGDPSKISYFSHLIIQEFLAGLYLIFFTPLNEFKKMVAGTYVGPLPLSIPRYDLTDGNWEMVTKFMFGICNKDTHKMLQTLISDLHSNVSKKAGLLYNFALRSLPNQIISANNEYFQNILPVCIWTHELNDTKLAAEVAQRLKKRIVVMGKVVPSDVASLRYILDQRQTALELDCTKYETWFENGSITHFMNAMEQCSETNPHIMVNFIKYYLRNAIDKTM